MTIDHIFIFVDSKEIANTLVDFGLTEGSGNVHKGIGTANRRFFFENFYLEILWVENKLESQSIEEIGIWERSNYVSSEYSRFGLCLKNTNDTDAIFTNSIQWKPKFLKDNEYVNILTSKKLPWIFRFPANRTTILQDEPKTHKIGIKNLTKVIFTLPKTDFHEKLNHLENNSIVKMKNEKTNALILEFDNGKKGIIKKIKELDLVIKY